MESSFDSVRASAMGLSAAERSLLADELLASIDEDMPSAVEAAWVTEVLRRRAEAEANPEMLLDGEAVFREIRAELKA